MRATRLVLYLLNVFLLLNNDVSAIRLESFYPFGGAAGDAFLTGVLDGSSPPIALPSQFVFFGQIFDDIYVSQTYPANHCV